MFLQAEEYAVESSRLGRTLAAQGCDLADGQLGWSHDVALQFTQSRAFYQKAGLRAAGRQLLHLLSLLVKGMTYLLDRTG